MWWKAFQAHTWDPGQCGAESRCSVNWNVWCGETRAAEGISTRYETIEPNRTLHLMHIHINKHHLWFFWSNTEINSIIMRSARCRHSGLPRIDKLLNSERWRWCADCACSIQFSLQLLLLLSIIRNEWNHTFPFGRQEYEKKTLFHVNEAHRRA